MRTLLIAALFTIAAATPFKVLSAEALSKQQAAESILSDQLVSFVDQETQHRELAVLLAPIKSSADLITFLRSAAKRNNPINLLSAGAKKRFVESLTFNEKGLTGYEYADLEAELSASEIYQVLSLFGAQHTTSLLKGARVQSKADKIVMSMVNNSPMLPMPDYQDYWCSSRATCSSSLERICMSAC